MESLAAQVEGASNIKKMCRFAKLFLQNSLVE